jgi:hypothetical protein
MSVWDIPLLPGMDAEKAKADKLKAEEEGKRREQATNDPRIISTMVMRILKSPATYRWVPDKGMVKVSAKLGYSHYDMEISYKVDGEDRKMTVGGPSMAFPVISLEREAELLRK